MHVTIRPSLSVFDRALADLKSRPNVAEKETLMAVLVRIPTPLRTLTKGAAEVQAAGDTVSAVIEDLERQFPGLRDRLVDDGGELRRFINIYVNEEDIRFLEGAKTTSRLAPSARIGLTQRAPTVPGHRRRQRLGKLRPRAPPCRLSAGDDPVAERRSRAFISSVRSDPSSEMTRVNNQYDGINLAQGMPNFPPPRELVEAAHRALDGDFHQYAITWGTPRSGAPSPRSTGASTGWTSTPSAMSPSAAARPRPCSPPSSPC